jgi:alpha-1,6-mannosyltransferase
VLEAQACGLPCVGISGSFMDANIMAGLDAWSRDNTAASLADAVERFGEMDLAALGAEASLKVHARFSWQRVFVQQWDLYSRARLQGADALHGLESRAFLPALAE